MNIKRKFQVGYWNIGIIERPIEDIMQGEMYNIRWLKHDYTDRFFADPFIYKQDKTNYYILAEELIFLKKRGTIVLLSIDRKTLNLTDRREVIKDQYHLSYPNYENKSIVAENYESGGLYRFNIAEKEVKKELIVNLPLIDPTFVEYNGKKWLFATQKDGANDKLYIYYEKNGEFIPHKKNPVKEDICTARPGGKFFKFKGNIYRPAQNCKNIYGEDIRLMKINRLDEEGFQEEEVLKISSHDLERYNLGLHTFNVGDGYVVVDGFEYSTQIIQKIKNKLAKY